MDEIRQPLFMNIRQWINFSIAIITGVIVFIVWLAIALHVADEQFITDDELQRNLVQLQSYTAESQVLDRYTRQGSTLSNYSSAYASSLKNATDDIAEKLTDHAHQRSLSPQVSTTIRLADLLSERLDRQVRQPTSQLGNQPQADQFYGQLHSRLHHVEMSI